MVIEIEVDSTGRIVIPAEFSDALHLAPGTKLVLREDNGAMILRPRGLYWEKGMPLFETGPLPADHVNWLQMAREERADELFTQIADDPA